MREVEPDAHLVAGGAGEVHGAQIDAHQRAWRRRFLSGTGGGTNEAAWKSCLEPGRDRQVRNGVGDGLVDVIHAEAQVLLGEWLPIAAELHHVTPVGP